MPRPTNPAVRLRLLDAGLALLHANGFHGSGVKEIADTASVPKGSFYSYFPSKEEFAVQVLEHYWACIDQEFAVHLRDHTVPPLQRVENFFQAMTEDNQSRNFALGCLIGNLALEIADHSADARATLADVMDRWSGLLADCLREARLDTADLPAQDRAAVIIEAWEGAVLRGRIEQSRRPYDRFASTVLPRLLGRRVVAAR
ncbi:TetR family transcriptional regulator C-terminal domain-containing protein [Amycolatopsis sp. NPDC047767]|uniref:TetR/AcrR family transcriptional regulator n=1 Tax=Amycolatopsis sp. NPDC047767 TaxID=3156765 RepID=UPI003453C884